MTEPPALEAQLDAVRSLTVDEVAEAIRSVGFECTDCGACCRSDDVPHTATVFPDEARRLRRSSDDAWRDVVRPMPFGLDAEGTGETIEWAIQTDGCGDCRFLEEEDDGRSRCGVYADRPSICRTYPFTLAATPGGAPLGAAVERTGPVVAHECEGLGRDIDPERARDLAREVLERGERSLEEAIEVREVLADASADGETVVVDSEGRKDPDGRPIDGHGGQR